MAVTVVYEFNTIEFRDLVSTSSAMDLTGLANGGLAGLGDGGPDVDATFFDAGLSQVGTSQNITGLNGSLDQLTNGNVVMMAEVAGPSGGLSYRIVTDTGAPVLADTSIGDSGASAPDVAALTGGGFVSTHQDFYTATDSDIRVRIYTAAGQVLFNSSVDETDANDQAPAITGLADGGFAVAWTRDLGGGVSEAWHAAYEANGDVRLAPQTFDNVTSVKRNMAIVALADGGYAVAYEDDFLSPANTDITLAFFTAAGGVYDYRSITADASNQTDPALAVLSNGMIAVTWSTDLNVDRDVHMQLVDPVTRDSLLANAEGIAASGAHEFDSAVAGWGLARFAVSVQGAVNDVTSYHLKRNVLGDGAPDAYVGDDALDSMAGAGGGDSLFGMANNDTLFGQAGNDTLNGGLGSDYIDGGDNVDSVVGGGGEDVLYGGGGADNILGGAGNDLVFGGFGSDSMSGGTEIDTLSYFFLAGETFLNLGFSGPQNTHSGGLDSFIGFEHATTGHGDDRVIGSGQPNILNTQGGADTIKAKDGDDVIIPGDGSDKVSGGGGADYIRGHGGRDFLRGGLGSDTFDYDLLTDSAVGVAVCDVIRDFKTAEGDKIDLSFLIPGAFSYIGAAAFGGVAVAEVRVFLWGAAQVVDVDANGDGVSDMYIVVQNAGLTGGAGDFVL